MLTGKSVCVCVCVCMLCTLKVATYDMSYV